MPRPVHYFRRHPEAVAVLLRLHAAGGFALDIAGRIGCTPSQVKHELRRLGLRTNRVSKRTPELDARLLELRAAGWTDREVAAALPGYTVDVVTHTRKVLARAAAAPPGPAVGRRVYDWPALDPQIRERHAGGMSDKQMAKVLGISTSVLTRRRAALGLPVLFNAPGRPPRPDLPPDAARERYRNWLAARGLPSLAAVQTARNREVVRRYGLPDSVTPTGLAVVLALTGGPLTITEIAAAVGVGRPGESTKAARARFTRRDVAGGNVIDQLKQLGLVSVSRRFDVKRQLPAVHMLTAAAMDLLDPSAAP